MTRSNLGLSRLRGNAGCYVYVGSAFGPGGLRARIYHHQKSASNPHWHIDYLRKRSRLFDIWYSSEKLKREHEWAAMIASMSGAVIPFPKFGSSDCDCVSHLSYHPDRPSYTKFNNRILAAHSGHAIISQELV